MKNRLLALIAVAIFLLSACGGGGGGSNKPITSMIQAMPEEPAAPETTTPPETTPPPPTPAAGPSLAGAAPVVDTDTGQDRYQRYLTGIRHVGADVAPSGALSGSPSHDGVTVSHGPLRDGVGRDQVVAWLEQNADHAKSWGPGFPGLPIHSKLPVVRIVEGASEKYQNYVVRAVQAINAALPGEWQLQIGDDAPVPTSREGIADGEVFVEFAPAEDWRPEGQTYAATLHPIVDFDSQNRLYLGAGHIQFDPDAIWIDPDRGGELDREQNTIGFMVHELIHTLGFLAHPDDLVSVMSYNRDLTYYGGNPTHFLYALDREVLLAAYTRLSPNVDTGDIATDLGPWSDTSIHVRGVLGLQGGNRDVAFGTAVRNGFAQPWAYGPAPSMDIEDNTALTGSARWSGRMLGFTPRAEAVAGAADLTVRLESLTGDIDFTGLESWAANTAPGTIGTGTMWGDGDLGYTIAVNGNTFVQTGGDTGTVTGAFLGRAHEGMGGVLERNDLSAGFGGKR